MTRQQLLELVRWEDYPRIPAGGQQTNGLTYGVRLICDDFNFDMVINPYRSQLKNKELAWNLFELYLTGIGVEITKP